MSITTNNKKQVEGSIYLFALISQPYLNLLITLQSNLANLVQAPGDMDFTRFRAFKNQVRAEDEPMRFVDGEMIERFLDVGEEVQAKAIEGLGTDLESVRGLVEGLRRLR
jgi:DNA damage-binding protein 1